MPDERDCSKVRAALEELERDLVVKMILGLDGEFLVRSNLAMSNGRDLDELVPKARAGDRIARKIVDAHIADIIRYRRMALPEPLASYAADLIERRLPPMKRGRSELASSATAMAIKWAVQICMRHKLRRTRSRANYGTDKPSACSVTRDFLATRRGFHISEARIEALTNPNSTSPSISA